MSKTVVQLLEVKQEAQMDKALRGRMLLWLTAVQEARSLLQTRSRIEDKKKEIASSMSAEPGASRADVGAFPHYADCTVLSDACVSLSIVYFCQTINKGQAVSGAGDAHPVSKSTSQLGQTNVIAAIQAKGGDADAVRLTEELLKKLLTARDRMLAHADGTAFDLKSISVGTKSKMLSSAWEGIDLGHFQHVVETFENWILDHIGNRVVVRA